MASTDIPLEPPLVKGPGIVAAVEDRSYLGYIAVALVSALAGGFLLAIWMPLAATGTLAPSDRVPWMIQAHGWLQLQGWAGMFVAGMTIRLIPRFAGRKPIARRMTVPLLCLLAVPLILRLVLEPWATGDLANRAAVVIGVTSAAGQLAVAAVLAFTLAKGRKPREPWRYFAWAGTAWWVAWAFMSVWFIASSQTTPGLLSAGSNDGFLWAVMLAPIGNFIWGVQSRSVPIFFGRKTPRLRAVLAPGAALNGGAVLILFGSAGEHLRTEGTGFILAGIALMVLPWLCGSAWGEAKRLRPRAKPAARFVLGANISALLAGPLFLFAGARLWTGDASSLTGAFHALDAARHLLGLGLITMLILGMARLVAPVFALERTESGVPRLFERAPFWLLLVALALRVSAALFAESLGYESRMHAASLAGMLGWAAIAIFAASVVRAARAEPRTKRALEEVANNARAQNG
ncbi:MAG: hypothetical protein ABI577_16280 [bacterium]